MTTFLLGWHRAGDRLPDAVVALADAYRAVSDVAPRRVLDSTAGAWLWQSAWAPGAEDALPLRDAGWLLSGTLRLDDRRALAARLRDRGADCATTDDAGLALAALRAWGDDAPSRWMGDYALAALAPARDRLVVARGTIGVRACFVATRGALSFVSDDLTLLVAVLRALRGRTAPVDQAVAEYLRHGQLVSPHLTFHEGIERVPAAHTLVVGRDGRARLSRHWDLPAPDVRHDRIDDEVVDEFRDVLGAAVADRLRGPRAALLLSGGLDSPALAAEARRVRADVQLTALTASWARLLDDAEPALARAVAAQHGIAHEVLAFAPDDGLPGGAPFLTPEPAPDVEARLWRAQAQRLAAHAPVVLNGEDVDALLTPPTILDQVRTDGVRATAAAWRAYRHATGHRPWLGMRRAIREALGNAPEPAPDWLRPRAAEQGRGSRDAPRAHPTRSAAAHALRQPIWDGTCWLDEPAMSGADLIVLLPFMDPRVIAFCFALPPVPWMQQKHLLRRAYRESLPAEVLARPKTPLRGYYEARVRIWREAGGPAAASALIGPVERWVDPTVWHRAISEGRDADAVYAAWRVLELARWLAQPEDR
jgi:asparagine synthase (glutamine-hydrolysing)